MGSESDLNAYEGYFPEIQDWKNFQQNIHYLSDDSDTEDGAIGEGDVIFFESNHKR
ncbi:MAG: hypothetical protein HQK50_05340 [Oligoflexia bacterium]|nr:hypothetical protein [Oligoflexia bacterium]MBF0364972.1 hypothetical protein [Oligoflexia bacterium]